MKKLVINNISKSFETAEGKKLVLNNVSFSMDEGSCCVIGGENGSGKSVLMSIIAGLEEADCGSVDSFEKVGLIFQEAETQILGETPFEDVSLGPKNQKVKKEDIKGIVENALSQVGLLEKADSAARFLSGGEKRRLAVACMLAMNLPILIFDEPYANLDYEGVRQINSLIKKLKEEGKTVIILTHEIEKCLGLSDHFIVLFRGNVVFDGKPEEGLNTNLEEWNIRNPLVSYKKFEDLVWL